MSVKEAVEAANACVEDREDIPGAPLWHMGKVAAFESQASFDLLQNTIDYLACKGKAQREFSDDEKEFMKELFEALWWGGKYHGFEEAARLADHYVNGEGKILRINPEVYKTSVIVADTMAAMKSYIREQAAARKPVAHVTSASSGFLKSPHATPLKRGKRNLNTQGYLLDNGALLAEQSNQRLKNADHRFYLKSGTTRGANGLFVTRWSVESVYDFEPFSKGYVTEIPLAKGFVMKLPDGLSHHLSLIGVASDFKYTTEWTETWK